VMKKRRYATEKLYYEVEVRDKDGKLLHRERRRANSYLKQYIALLKGLYFHKYNVNSIGNVTVTDTGGVSRAYPSSGSSLNVSGIALKADAAEGDYGLMVGASDGANIVTTYSLGTPIAHGVGAGQLQYGASVVEDPSNPSGMDWIIRIIRTYTNGSGGSVTVKEIALYTKTVDSGVVARVFAIARDVLGTPAVVPNGSTLTVRYIPKITVA